MLTHGGARRQQGAALLEALFAVLLFSVGVLGLVGLQAASIKNSADAKYRSDAAQLAKQIVGQMWVDRSNIDHYAHHPAGPTCALTGAASADVGTWVSPVPAWVAQVASLLPGAGSAQTQIQVNTVGASRQVQVTVCWKGPQETVTHNVAMTAQINVP
jgi:type IV pilus assembly protein PilV